MRARYRGKGQPESNGMSEASDYVQLLRSDFAALWAGVAALANGGIAYGEDGTTQCVFCLDYGAASADIILHHLPSCPVMQAQTLVTQWRAAEHAAR